MSLLEGRVAIVTGAGRGLGRAHALKLAEHGAKLVINDLGSSSSGEGVDQTPAQEVVAAIEAMGGQAVVNTSDVSNWNAAQEMVQQAVDTFGRLDVLVNNAGILRDRMLVNMTEDEWDTVVKVHLKGTFAPIHHAANYWRLESKAGRPVDARIINTTSHSALFANIGQANYASAKGGIATLTQLAARELGRIGVTVNAIAPRAETRMTAGLSEGQSEERMARRDPEWIAAMVAWLASPESKSISGRIFETWGYGYSVIESWQHGPQMEASRDPTEIGEGVKRIAGFARPNAGIDRNTWLNP
ncbi:SDR family oxidoreductase [Sphingomonas aliaeris]|uniref:SDR family oxidoreductase n=1 Tax=Sphingomonas aliaeris TaxID=2759526 RepID=A0A974S4P3_9SPHN|nr:SDR family oxidoreductase [Sphingomonas aliaeris]QQV77664.1 SDR family oxidoreductase [Sphingomonas aliaeris]